MPFIRGCVNFFDAQVVGVKALMRSADLAPEGFAEEDVPSKFDLWLEQKLGNEKFQNAMHDYFDGKSDYNTALEKFYSDIAQQYPELSR